MNLCVVVWRGVCWCGRSMHIQLTPLARVRHTTGKADDADRYIYHINMYTHLPPRFQSRVLRDLAVAPEVVSFPCGDRIWEIGFSIGIRHRRSNACLDVSMCGHQGASCVPPTDFDRPNGSTIRQTPHPPNNRPTNPHTCQMPWHARTLPGRRGGRVCCRRRSRSRRRRSGCCHGT